MVKWFNEQSNVLKFILLILPFVGWVCELVLRWSAVAEEASVKNIVVALIYTFFGWAWVLGLVDAILALLDKKLLFQ